MMPQHSPTSVRFALGVATIGAISLMITGCGDGVDATLVTPSIGVHTSSPAEAPAPSDPTPSKTPLGAQIEALEIPAGLEPQQLGEAYIELTNKWWNAGTEDPQALKGRRDKEGTSWAKLAPVIAQENKVIYAPALFGADWESNPEAVTAVERMVKANESTLSNFMATAFRSSGAIGYKAWSELTGTSVYGVTVGERLLQLSWKDEDNNKESTGGEKLVPDGGSVVINWKTVSDKEYATSVR